MDDAAKCPAMIVPDFDRTGGYERQAFYLARSFVARGVDAFIVTNNTGDRRAREVRDGVRIHRLGPLPHDRPSFPNLYKSFLLFLLSHRREYDVIHCHSFSFEAAFCVLIGKLLRKPVLVKVATEHDIREFRDGRDIGHRSCYPLLKRADRLLCLSESIRDEFVACGFRQDRLARVHNGVDTVEFQPVDSEQKLRLRRELGLDAGTFHFVFAGRLVRRKGVDVLLHALATRPELSHARTILLGDGAERGALERLATALGVGDRVRFAGEHPDPRPWFGAADAFVFPSRREGLPNALLEAMSSGLPAVATRIGGCTDVLAGGGGTLVAADDPAELAQAMCSLMTDATCRERLAREARDNVVNRFAFQRIVPVLQRSYRELVRRRGV